jgi:VanZ family protein
MSVLIHLLLTGSTGINYNQFPHQDKLLHFAAFFCGQFLVMFSNIKSGLLKKMCYLFFLSLPLLAEYVQSYLPSRVTDKWDMIAGCLGIIVCVILFVPIRFAQLRYEKIKYEKRMKIKGEY